MTWSQAVDAFAAPIALIVVALAVALLLRDIYLR